LHNQLVDEPRTQIPQQTQNKGLEKESSISFDPFPDLCPSHYMTAVPWRLLP